LGVSSQKRKKKKVKHWLTEMKKKMYRLIKYCLSYSMRRTRWFIKVSVLGLCIERFKLKTSCLQRFITKIFPRCKHRLSDLREIWNLGWPIIFKMTTMNHVVSCFPWKKKMTIRINIKNLK
jgi:hypothetical protein